MKHLPLIILIPVLLLSYGCTTNPPSGVDPIKYRIVEMQSNVDIARNLVLTAGFPEQDIADLNEFIDRAEDLVNEADRIYGEGGDPRTVIKSGIALLQKEVADMADGDRKLQYQRILAVVNLGILIDEKNERLKALEPG